MAATNRGKGNRSSETSPPPEENAEDVGQYPSVMVAISSLRPHPRNYQKHPPDQIAHLVESIKEHGQYRNVVISRDGTILAGHGVVQAMQEMGRTAVSAIRLEIESTSAQALKILTSDNEISHLAERDDRLLSELLKEVKEYDLSGLIGTGFDDQMLANLVYVTRPASEIATVDEAAHWVGMPEYVPEPEPLKMVISFRTLDDRAKLFSQLGLDHSDKHTISTWWPVRERRDMASVRFETKSAG